MNKKLLLSTTIASTLLISGIAMSSVKAVSSTRYSIQNSYVGASNKYSISIELPVAQKKLTRKELVNLINQKYGTNYIKEIKFGSTVIMGDDTLVPAGSVVSLYNGRDLTVVFFGDVKNDGSIDNYDALRTLKEAVSANTITETALRKAANVAVGSASEAEAQNVIDNYDAVRLLKVAADTADHTVDDLLFPADNIPSYNLAVTVNDNGVINNVNIKNSKLVITTDSPLSEPLTGCTLQIEDEKGSVVSNLGLDSSATTIEADKVKQEIKLQYNSETAGDLSTYFTDEKKDGVYVGILKNSKGEIIAEFTFEVCLGDVPEAWNITTEREGTPNGRLSFTGHSESKITKVYYSLVKLDASGDPDSESAPTELSKMKTLDVTDNKLDRALLDRELVNNTAYKVYFIVENEKGNRSKWTSSTNESSLAEATNFYTAIIVKDSIDQSKDKQAPVQSVTVPSNLGTQETTATFTWTEAADATSNKPTSYIVSLYKGNEVVAQYEIPYDEGSTVEKDFAADIKANGAGTYRVEVVATGKKDGSKVNSDPVSSDSVEIKQLEAVTGLTFTPNDTDPAKGLLSWTSPYTGDRKNEIKGFTIKVEKYDDAAKTWSDDAGALSGVASPLTDTQATLTLSPNYLYRASVTVEAKDTQLLVLDSEKTETTENFFTVSANALSVDTAKTTTNSVTLKVDKTQFHFGDKTLSYDIEVWKYNEEASHIGWDKVSDKCKTNVALDSKGNFVIDGLETGSKYGFILVVHVDESTGRSATSTPTVTETTKILLPEIKNLTVVTAADEIGAGKIAKTSSGLSINGTEILSSDFTKYYDPAGVLTQLQTAIGTNLISKDIVSYSDSTLTVDLRSHATSGAERALGTYDGITLKVVGNNYEKKLSGTVKNGNVVLSGDNAWFDLSTGFTVDEDCKVILETGVVATKLHSTNDVVIAGGAKVTVYGVVIETEAELPIHGTASKIVVAPNGENDVTYTQEVKEGVASLVEINYQGTSTWTSEQTGKIKLVSKGGNIKLTSDDVSLKGEIEAVLENGKVDLTDDSVVANKNVKVTVQGADRDNKSSEVKAVASTTVPDVGSATKVNALAFTNYELKEMTVDEIKAFFAAGGSKTELGNTAVTLNDDEAAEVKAFLDSFGLNDKGVKLTKSASTQEVTLTFSKDCSNVSVLGLD